MIQNLFGLYWELAYAVALLLLGPLFLRASIATGCERLAPVLPKIVLALAALHLALYLCAPGFADYGEPVVPLLAGNLLHGGVVYGDLQSGGTVIGSNYGPYLFLVQSWFIALTPSIAASKLAGMAAAVVSVLCLYRATVRPIASRDGAWTICALLVTLFAFQLHYWFWNRPDPFLVAITALGVLLVERRSSAVGLAGIGLLAGVACNFKLFGAVYLVPLAFACMTAPDMLGRRRAALAVGALLFAVALAFPFASGLFPLRPYLANVLLMRHQGLFLDGIVQSLLYGALILSLPLLALRRSGAAGEDRATMVVLALCMLLVAGLAGKPGGGPVYMMPFAPLSLYLAVRIWRRAAPRADDLPLVPQAALLALFVCALPVWGYSWWQTGRTVATLDAQRDVQQELRGLFEEFPGAEMGHGGSRAATEIEAYRVEKAFLGQVVRFDYVNYADQRFAGVPSSVVYPLLEGCAVPAWIFARDGQHFGGSLHGTAMFDDGVRERFAANYRLQDRSRHFEVWTCRGPGDPEPARGGGERSEPAHIITPHGRPT